MEEPTASDHVERWSGEPPRPAPMIRTSSSIHLTGVDTLAQHKYGVRAKGTYTLTKLETSVSAFGNGPFAFAFHGASQSLAGPLGCRAVPFFAPARLRHGGFGPMNVNETEMTEIESQSPGAVVGEDGLARCPWAVSHPLNLRYHDTEWGMPVRDERG